MNLALLGIPTEPWEKELAGKPHLQRQCECKSQSKSILGTPLQMVAKSLKYVFLF